jgi:ubiquinone/menaquinone biosynthesis C-methylase UbiE
MTYSLSDTARKVATHARQGTLFARLWERARTLGRREKADPDHYHGDVAKGYLEKRLQQQSWHREQEIVRELIQELPLGMKVLDVPFGTGRFVDMFLERNMDIYGVDISQDMLNAAKEALGPAYDRCKVHLGSAEKLPYDDKFFDLVVCFRFFGLISFAMARNVLREIHRVLRDKAIIRVPVRNDSVLLENRKPKSYESVQGQLSEQELLAMFNDFGFDVVTTRTIEEREKVTYKVYLLKRR